MGDIDFDELDKAVNSLMSSEDSPNNHKKPASSLHKKPMNSRPFPTSRRSVMAKNVSAPPKTPVASPSESIKVSKPTSPVVRRAGRFMDVVDSTAELNPIRQPIASPSRDVTRKTTQFTTIAADPVVSSDGPVESIAPAPFAIPSVVVPTRAPIVAAPAGDLVQVRRVEKNSIMPDPLELLQDASIAETDETIINEDTSNDMRPAAAFGMPTGEAATDVQSIPVTFSTPVVSEFPDLVGVLEATDGHVDTEVIVEPQAPEVDVRENTDAELESESPFLLDTKVEKRPLNANPVTIDSTEPLVLTDESPLIQDQNQPLLETQTDEFTTELVTEPPIPVSDMPELSSELVAIEATGKVSVEEDEQEEELVPIAMGSSTDGSKKVDDFHSTAGPASITQQYKSKESTGDTSHAPIYDASQYSDPVAHPAKKKSGWLWVLGVLILLALSSGGAVALYFTGIIP